MGFAAYYFEVKAPVEQVYAYWRDFSHFPSFMPDVKAGELVARLFKDPGKQLQQAAGNFREVVENGGLAPPTLTGQP